MSSSNIKLNDRILDELVSGSLRGAQYREVLLALEESPHLWRKCALAFLEEQALSQDLKSLSQGNIDWSPSEQSPASISADSIAGHPSNTLAGSLNPSHKRLAYASLDPQLWGRRVAVLAALLLVSFTVGWLGAGIRDRLGNGALSDSTNAGVFSTNPAKQNPMPDDRLAGVNDPPPIPNQELFGNDLFQPMDQQLALQLGELERAGMIQIETIESIVPVRLGDGSSVIVPVQQYRITPVAYSY